MGMAIPMRLFLPSPQRANHQTILCSKPQHGAIALHYKAHWKHTKMHYDYDQLIASMLGENPPGPIGVLWPYFLNMGEDCYVSCCRCCQKELPEPWHGTCTKHPPFRRRQSNEV